MKKFKSLIVCTILCGTIPSHAKITPIKLESTILKKFDGILINWQVIRFVKKYTSQMNGFMQKQYMIDNTTYTLLGLVKLEDTQSLSSETRHMFTNLADEVINFSEPFLDYLHGVKKELIELIEEDCIKRNRADSLLLKWAHVQQGGEHALFKQEIHSYRTLAMFCIDILCFLEDLMQSCPKAMQRYEYEVVRYNTIRSHIDELLQHDNKVLSSAHYKELVQTITAHYTQATVTKEATTELYRTYNTCFM